MLIGINEEKLFENGVWVIENRSHEGISIRFCGEGCYLISAWAENWDDLWGWEGKITREELELIVAEPSAADRPF